MPFFYTNALHIIKTQWVFSLFIASYAKSINHTTIAMNALACLEGQFKGCTIGCKCKCLVNLYYY